MKRVGEVLTVMAAVLLLSGVAYADVLQLASGGALKGTLQEVTVRVKGAEVTCARAEIKKIEITRSGRLALKKKDGSGLRGELVSLKFKSLAGELTFEQHNVIGLKLVADPLAAARKEFAEKRAAVDDDDAGALLELAKWSEDRGLKAEAVECARACLKANPDADDAEKAHKRLGHVLHKGQWLTPAQAMKKKQEDGDSDSPGGDTDGSASPAKEQLQAALKKNAELYETFKQRIDDAKDAALAALKKQYGKKWEDVELRIKGYTEEIRKRERARESERERHHRELQAEHHTKIEIENLLKARFDDFNSAYKTKVRSVREARLKAKLERTKLAGIIKPIRSKIMRKAGPAKAEIRLVFQRHERILRNGKLLTEKQMTKAFEALFPKKD